MYGLNVGLTELPPWLKEVYQSMAHRGEELAQMPYPRYKEPVIAPFAPEQLAAFDLAHQTGSYEPYYAQAREQFGRGAESFPEHYQQYMNPYMEQVVNQLAQMGGRSLEEHILPQVQAQFVGQGAERSTAHDEQRRRAMRDVSEAILREQQKALFQGYGETGKQFQEEKLRQLAAGTKQAELGRYAQAGRFGDIEQLSHAGQAKQAHAQNVLGEARAEHAREAFWPHAQQQQLAGTMAGIPQTGITSNVMYQPAPMQSQVNMPGQLGAAAMSLYGASQMGRAHGGAVKSPKKKAPFGLSHMKFKSSNTPQKHTKMKYKHPHEGRM